jgi:hypothetical protein
MYTVPPIEIPLVSISVIIKELVDNWAALVAAVINPEKP